MTLKRKELIHTLLKGIETGDAASVAVVNPDKYIQHNPQTHEGGEGLAALFKRLAKSSPRVNIIRIFSDGDYVFGHTQYDFGTSRIGFEVFRFEGDFTVEHWDNIQLKKEPNVLGHSMIDGPTEVTDLDKTESNRGIVKSFVSEVLINGHLDKAKQYIENESYTEHDPNLGDGVLSQYEINHRLLADGNFVLSVCEGSLDDVHSSFYDLYRLANDKIVEHWNTIEAVAPRSEWKNNNGKF
ncbi:MAG: hypothetical protein R8M46_04930 [Ghiorsea sp.]